MTVKTQQRRPAIRERVGLWVIGVLWAISSIEIVRYWIVSGWQLLSWIGDLILGQ